MLKGYTAGLGAVLQDDSWAWCFAYQQMCWVGAGAGPCCSSLINTAFCPIWLTSRSGSYQARITCHFGLLMSYFRVRMLRPVLGVKMYQKVFKTAFFQQVSC